MIKIRSLLLSSAAICLLPVVSYADYTVTNNTHFSYTADAKNPSTGYQSPCSAPFLGDAGIIKPVDEAPNNKITIPGGIVSFVCSPKCDVTVYKSTNCEAQRKVATVTISPNDGIGQPNNLPNADKIKISRKNANEAFIETGSKAGDIFDLMLKKLGV